MESKNDIHITGALENWCIHIIQFSDKTLATLQQVYPGALPIVVTGSVVEDRAGRFDSGCPMRSSWVMHADPNSNVIQTQNSTYLLLGEGRYALSERAPDDYFADVEKTISARRNGQCTDTALCEAIKTIENSIF